MKINKRGVLIRTGGSEKFSKINKRGGLLLGTLEYTVSIENVVSPQYLVVSIEYFLISFIGCSVMPSKIDQ